MSESSSTTPIARERTNRSLLLAFFATSLAWSISSTLLSASSAQGIANRLNIDLARPFIRSLFLVFLLAVGFSLLQTIARRPASTRFVLGLPNRPTAFREWLIGVALGWGMVLLAILPLVFTAGMHVSFFVDSHTLRLVFFNLAAITVGSLAEEVIFRGYPFRCLIETAGPVVATIVMSALFGLTRSVQNGATRTGIFMAFLSGIVFSVSWLRTHGLWLAWGMRFAWIASMGMLFGLPVAGVLDYATLFQTTTRGRTWLTGGDYGPEGATFTAVALLIGLIVLIRVTRDYAWDYTHPVIVPGGYPMDIPPPAAHAAMEQDQQSRPAALIQILPSTPQGRSSNQPIDTEPGS